MRIPEVCFSDGWPRARIKESSALVENVWLYASCGEIEMESVNEVFLCECSELYEYYVDVVFLFNEC